MDCSPPGSSVHGFSQARILEWVALSFSRASSQPKDQIGIFCISCTGRMILHHLATWETPVLTYYVHKPRLREVGQLPQGPIAKT